MNIYEHVFYEGKEAKVIGFQYVSNEQPRIAIEVKDSGVIIPMLITFDEAVKMGALRNKQYPNDYIVVEADSVPDLVANVNRKTDELFLPVGGMVGCPTGRNGAIKFYQTMFKK